MGTDKEHTHGNRNAAAPRGHAADRAGDRRDDLCLLRPTDREELNKLDGVTATVNYATEKASVTFPGTVTPQDLVSTVEATGYTAALPKPPAAEQTAAEPADELSTLRTRLIVSVVLSIPVIALAMTPRCSSPTGSGSR